MFIIELSEKVLSKWLILEIKHSSLIVGKENLLITNVKTKKHKLILSKFGKVIDKSIVELKNLHNKIIILDPKANKLLKPFEAKNSILVIGGILGDEPPKGRTYKYISSKLKKCKIRNLGKNQFSIDGAIYVAKLISQGIPFEKIPLVKGIKINVDPFHEIILPYVYPLVNNKPLIFNELIEYLKYGIEVDEEKIFRKYKLFSTEV